MPRVLEVDETRRRPRVQTVNDGPHLTVQDPGRRTEIQAILAKYSEVGIVDHLRQVELEYRDVSEFEDFRDVMLQAKNAEGAFMRLPPQVRDVFENDVSRWLDAAHDPDKLEALRPKLEKLGVMAPKVEPAPKSADGRLKNRRVRGELVPDPSLVERRRALVAKPRKEAKPS